MKKAFLLLLLAAFLPLTSVDAQTNIPDPNTDLVISIRPTRPVIKPRSITETPIEAYYCCDTLTLTFNENLGEANILVTNTSTGDVWSDNVAGLCTTSIMLPGAEGYYTITIYTDAGDYYGEFSL